VSRVSKSKKSIMKLLLSLAAGSVGFFLAGCPSPGTNNPPGPVELTPASITVTSTTLAAGVQQGAAFPVSVNVQNLQSGSVSATFTVDFYITANTTFAPGTDFHAGSASISGIAGNGTATGSATLNVPSTISNQCAYIYAVVDAAGVTGTSTTNTTSTTATAAVVLIYKALGGQTYNNVVVETYLPTGSQTPTANTWIALYQDNGSGSCSLVSGEYADSTGAGVFGSLNITGLASGKYYILVLASYAPGSFAINVRTTNINQEAVQAVPSAPSTSNYNQLSGIPPLFTYTGPSPTNGVAIDAGNALSWYIPSGVIEWFTFTLP